MFDIIICTYNGEKIIKRAIESILRQKKFIEVVNNFYIVDNNSNDRTKELILNYEKGNKKIKYLFQPKQGLSNARLKGVQNVTSDWIIFIDDDNILDQNWLVNAKKYIKENLKVGVFNGAVYPLIEDELSVKERINLKVAYKGLACTHLKKEDINLENNIHPCKLPFGAGLVIKAKELKKLAEKGWLKSEGRKGCGKLVSGEDTEMVMAILEKGYLSGYMPKCQIQHLIDKNRLQEEYLISLFKSFREYSKKTKLKRRINIYIKQIIVNVMLWNPNKNYEEKLKLKLGIISFKKNKVVK